MLESDEIFQKLNKINEFNYAIKKTGERISTINSSTQEMYGYALGFFMYKTWDDFQSLNKANSLYQQKLNKIKKESNSCLKRLKNNNSPQLSVINDIYVKSEQLFNFSNEIERLIKQSNQPFLEDLIKSVSQDYGWNYNNQTDQHILYDCLYEKHILKTNTSDDEYAKYFPYKKQESDFEFKKEMEKAGEIIKLSSEVNTVNKDVIQTNLDLDYFLNRLLNLDFFDFSNNKNRAEIRRIQDLRRPCEKKIKSINAKADGLSKLSLEKAFNGDMGNDLFYYLSKNKTYIEIANQMKVKIDNLNHELCGNLMKSIDCDYSWHYYNKSKRNDDLVDKMYERYVVNKNYRENKGYDANFFRVLCRLSRLHDEIKLDEKAKGDYLRR